MPRGIEQSIGATAQSNIEIVQPGPDNWKSLKYLKVRSLMEEPVAFEDPSSSLEKYHTRSETEWRAALGSRPEQGDNNPDSITVFARDVENGEPIGMVKAVINATNKSATVQHIYVVKNGYRGQGVGSKLLNNLLMKLKSRGVKVVNLEVIATQYAAFSLYKKSGFKATKFSKRSATREGARYDEIEMELVME